MSLNSVSLVGRVGNVQEIKYFESGRAKLALSLATERPGKDEKTDWHRIELWGKAAENAAEHVKRGDLLAVTGSLQYEEWEKDGQKQKMAVVGNAQWRFVREKKGGDGGGDRQNGQTHDAYGEEIPF